MASRTWEEEYERNQSRLRDTPVRCQHRTTDGQRCPRPGKYRYQGYFPLVNEGVLCEEHRREKDVSTGPAGA